RRQLLADPLAGHLPERAPGADDRGADRVPVHLEPLLLAADRRLEARLAGDPGDDRQPDDRPPNLLGPHLRRSRLGGRAGGRALPLLPALLLPGRRTLRHEVRAEEGSAKAVGHAVPDAKPSARGGNAHAAHVVVLLVALLFPARISPVLGVFPHA